MSAQPDDNEQQQPTLTKQAYQHSFNNKHIKIAFLYRKDELQPLIDETFTTLSLIFATEEPKFIHRLTNLFSTQKLDETIIKKFIEAEIKIFQGLQLNLTRQLTFIINQIWTETKKIKYTNTIQEYIGNVFKSKEEDELDVNMAIEDGLTEQTSSIVYSKYFTQSYQNICDGMVYSPPERNHAWQYNAAWLQGHFNKGTDTFVIRAPINQASKLRGNTSDKKGQPGSGFFREIAICS